MDIKKLRKQVDEIKALFVLAERVLPFMEELFVFIDETSPLLEDINNAIKDNLSKMPNASKQLSKVTQATELASTEIMDTVDRVNNGLYDIINQLEEFKKHQTLLLSNPIHLLETIASGIEQKKDLNMYVKEIYQFIERSNLVTNTEHTKIITELIDNVRNISDDANTIINSLQVQDITAQQLAAVNHLLENVQTRLGSIMEYLNDPEDKTSRNKLKAAENDTKITSLHRSIAFDPDAIEALNTDLHRQDDIDALLANPDLLDQTANTAQATETSTPAKSPPPPPPPAADSGADDMEDFSQDDIDALFGGG
jgi:chromosome segregation ATPase